MNAPAAPARMTSRFAHLSWPLFGDAHRALVLSVGELGEAVWLRYALGDAEACDVCSRCLIREVLAYYGGLPDYAFAMQGLGTRAIALAGTDRLKAEPA